MAKKLSYVESENERPVIDFRQKAVTSTVLGLTTLVQGQYSIVTETKQRENICTMNQEILPGGSTVENTAKMRVHHGGRMNKWICTCCLTSFNAPGILRKHAISHHQRKVIFVCTKCDQVESEDSRSVGTHMRYCGGPTTTPELEYKCDYCTMSFKTSVGRTQHVRLKHPKEYNELLIEQKSKKWIEIELKDMAELEAKYISERGNNRGVLDEIQKLFPNRTRAALYKIKQGEVYLAFYNEAIRRYRENEQIEEEEEEMMWVMRPKIELDISDHEPLNLDQSLEIDIILEENNLKDNLRNVIQSYIDDTSPDDSKHRVMVVKYLNNEINWLELGKYFEGQSKKGPEKKEMKKPENNYKPVKNNRSTRRRILYREVQRRFRKNRKETVRDLIEGQFEISEKEEESPNLEDLYNVYIERLETVKGDLSPDIREVDEYQANCNGYGAFMEEEIREAIDSTDKETAPGPDSWKLTDVIKISKQELTMLFNKWYLDGAPEEIKVCRTILIYKAGDKKDVGNWRPITIGSILLRLYAKVWDSRIRKNVSINNRQKAFRPVDGCFENVKILQDLIQVSRRRRKELNVVILDLAKAFDTVSHESIVKALRRKEVPETIVKVITDMYSNASTKIVTKKGSTERIMIKSGVKQGCPLSPLLFNLVMDELVERMQESELGERLNEEHIAVMAFADDLVVISNNDYKMRKLLKIVEKFLDEKGLRVNAKKCLSFKQVPTKKGRAKNMKVVTEEHRYWKELGIPSLTYDNFAKYLGMMLKPNGKAEIPWDKWNGWLENLRKASLKPEQKIVSLKEIVIPKMIHQLRLGSVGISQLKKLNIKIRVWFKKILHLPQWTPNEWVHGRFGGALHDITNLIVACRKKASENMLKSEDKIASDIGMKLSVRHDADLRRLKVDHLNHLSRKVHWESERKEKWSRRINGTALTTMTLSTVKREWIWYADNIPSWKRLRCLQMLSGTIPTRINENRGNPRNPDLRKCRACKGTAETDMHILNECGKRKDQISKRHNVVCDITARFLKKKNLDVVREKRWRLNAEAVNRAGQQHIQPDLSVEMDSQLTWIEITVPYESSNERLELRRVEKLNKYNWIKPINIGRPDLHKIEVYVIVVGSCGTIPTETRQTLKKLRILSCAKNLQMAAMLKSAELIQTHMRYDDAGRH